MALANSPHQDLIGKMIPPHNGYIIADLRIRSLPNLPGRPQNLIWGTVGPVSIGPQKTFGIAHPGINCSVIRCQDCGKRGRPEELNAGRCSSCYETYLASLPPVSMKIDVAHEKRMRDLATVYHLEGGE